MVKESVTIELH